MFKNIVGILDEHSLRYQYRGQTQTFKASSLINSPNPAAMSNQK
jgi:hypothetical protein